LLRGFGGWRINFDESGGIGRRYYLRAGVRVASIAGIDSGWIGPGRLQVRILSLIILNKEY
jgi:hypothetical protein